MWAQKGPLRAYGYGPHATMLLMLKPIQIEDTRDKLTK